uniref:Uncharacterized protein n=1 Tax=Actinobacteria phage HS02 TaxID=3056388 RepID=A0AA49X3C8_9VIRU|nr:MAG: hypothetical protein [Actinobacteria phage HS02]
MGGPATSLRLHPPHHMKISPAVVAATTGL